MPLGFYSVLIFVSIIGATNAQQQLGRHDGLTRFRVCNRDAVVFHDDYGNKILDGRSGETADFEIHFTPNYIYGPKFYVEFCAKDIGCDQEKGLILCWEAPKWLKRNTSGSSNGRIKDLLAQCGDYQGVMVTTVNGGNQFRIDTVHGSTYEFVVSADPNCFSLWLFGFDPYPGTRKQISATQKKRSIVNAWYPELRTANALSLSLDYDGSNNGLPSEHPGDFKENDRIRDLSNKPIVMKDEEIQIAAEAGRFWEMRKEDFESHYFTAKFKAVGGGGCCNLSAKIMGKELSKCYYHWKDLIRCKDIKACSAIVQYGYHPKPLYDPSTDTTDTYLIPTSPNSVLTTTTEPDAEEPINTSPFSTFSPIATQTTTMTTTTANPNWAQHITDPKQRTELEKKFGVYLPWNPVAYPIVSKAAQFLLTRRFSSAFPATDTQRINSFVTESLYKLRLQDRYELQPGENASITIKHVETYWGEFRQAVFRCLGIQIDTTYYEFFDNSDAEKEECEKRKKMDQKPWPPVCDKQ
ncbi:hypothetical protein DdX_17284 [Ditylenchus destructor]|uniref:Uncharacterized protein n=1 Tax=Ditylenchus destructor TaxID=166010 RepID=A0AAD4QZ47_9BILA|nr:hypothetical protein DdX_17284 [Ditylenchus destructor]